jgi:D-sedoheptulose 7-phosphate isomerase
MSENSSVVKMLKDNIGLHQKVLSNILLLNQISEICNKIVLAIVSEKKVMACGNGGSAADAQHLIACVWQV